MTSPASTTNDALYHLYVGSDWTGPYQVADIRKLLTAGEVQNDTFAYDATNERHLTVEALIAEADKPKSAAPASSGAMNSSLFIDTTNLPPAQAPQEFPLVIPDLRSLYQAFIGLTESTTGDKHALAHQLRKSHQAVNDSLAKRQSSTGDLYALVNQIDEVADYLANRHQIPELWQLISEMEKVDLAAETAHGISCAEAVLKCLVDRAERHEPAVSPNGGLAMLLDVDDQDEHDSVATRKILLSARHEMHSAKQDVNALQEAYSELESRHQQDLAEANRLLAAAEKARSVEHQVNEQAMAELRALAAEIHRIASEPDIVGGTDATLLSEVAHLGSELGSTDPSTLAYLAEDVLIRMVERLRALVRVPEDIAPLREELIKARAVIAQATVIAAERDVIKQQYQDQCRAAERANIQARDREHRLRSMVTALEVTKELHQEVMGDLQSELRSAQTRVETMERELASVRGEIKGSTSNLDQRSRELRDEMQRMVEMRSMLEVRREELSHNLAAAEAELAKAKLDQSADAGVADTLIAKVAGLKQTLEITTKRLGDQEEIAKRLELELSSSRSESNELHGRSDDLTRELDEARTSLAIAKKRAEELNVAYGRLESERSSLQQELAHRKSTDTIRKAGSGEPETSTARFEKITSQLAEVSKQADSLEHALSGERRKVLALAEAQVDAQKRIEDLTAERQALCSEADGLQSERTADHARHASALSVSIRASIESESRLKVAQERIIALQAQLSELSGSPQPATAGAPDEPALQTELIAARAQRDEAQMALTAAIAERDRLAALVAAPPQAATGTQEGTEQALAEAITTRDEIHTKLMQTVGERDRLRREFDRLKNEFDSAAVEHRTALKSARDRLSEAQARTAEIERQLAEAKPGQADERSDALQAQLAEAQREQARLRDELQRQTQQLERLNSGRSTDRDSQLIELARATQQLSAEQERVQALSRSLVESLHAAETARSRTIELQAKLAAQSAEREQYQLECERLRRELADIRLQGFSTVTGTGQKSLQDALESRQQALNELDRVNAELSQLRASLATGDGQQATLSRIATDQARIRTLEQQVNDARAEHLKTEQMFNEARARLVQVSSERDRLALEIAQLRAQPDHGAELRVIRRRLIRAKKRMRMLRDERDQALARDQVSTASVSEMTSQLNRVRSTQRAVAEALGLSVSNPPLPPMAQSDPGTASFNTSRLGAALQPMISGEESSVQQGVPRALTRRVGGEEPVNGSAGFTSVFGRPAIPGLPTSQTQASPLQNQGVVQPSAPLSALDPRSTQITTPVTMRVRPSTLTLPRRMRHLTRLILLPGMVAASAAMAIGFLSMPPLMPFSSNCVVNSKVVPVRAPIDGRLSPVKKNKGDVLRTDETLAVIHNDQVDTSTRDSMTFLSDGAKEERQSIDADLTAKKQLAEALSNELLARRKEIDVGLQSRLTALRTANSAQDVTPASSDRAAAIDQLVRQISELQTGQFPEGLIPPAAAKLTDLHLEITNLEHKRADCDNQIADLKRRIDKEDTKLASLRESPVTTPIAGPLWKRLAGDGSWVKAGDNLMLVADPSTIQVEASIGERYLEDIAIGDAVEIRLQGEHRIIRGIVRTPLVALDSAAEGQASPLVSALPNHFRLIVSVDENVIPGMALGAGARILVIGQNAGFGRRLLAWIYEQTKL